MEKQQSYSHGLLYSVAPENFSTLHLHDNDSKDAFDWEAYEAEYRGDSFMRIVLNLLRTTAAKWKPAKLQ